MTYAFGLLVFLGLSWAVVRLTLTVRQLRKENDRLYYEERSMREEAYSLRRQNFNLMRIAAERRRIG